MPKDPFDVLRNPRGSRSRSDSNSGSLQEAIIKRIEKFISEASIDDIVDILTKLSDRKTTTKVIQNGTDQPPLP